MSDYKIKKFHEIMKRLDELVEESIIMIPDKEILEDLNKNPNPAFQKHLDYIKEKNEKIKRYDD